MAPPFSWSDRSYAGAGVEQSDFGQQPKYQSLDREDLHGDDRVLLRTRRRAFREFLPARVQKLFREHGVRAVGRARRLYLTGGSYAPDTFSYSRQRLYIDATAEFRVTKSLQVFAAVKNLNNTPEEFDNMSSVTPEVARLRQHEDFAALWTFGVKGSFCAVQSQVYRPTPRRSTISCSPSSALPRSAFVAEILSSRLSSRPWS